MIKHTPEPWAAYRDASGDVFISSAETSFHIAEVGSEDDETVIPDARRIVACVNACEGVDTDLLEAGELDKPTMLIMQENKDLKLHCDELLAALEGVLICGRGSSGRIILDDFDEQCVKVAIAKVKGIYHE